MRRVLGVCVTVLVIGCGGGGSGGKGKNADAGTSSDGNAVGDRAPDTTGAGGAAGRDAAAADGPAGSDGSAGATDVAASGDADGALVAETGDAPGDARDAGVDVATDVATDATGEAASDGADAEAAAPRLVTVAFTGTVETVAPAPDAGMPLGFDSTVRLAPVSGSFTYDLRMLDEEPTDPLRGKFEGAGGTAFSFTLEGHTVTGSGNAVVETENLNPDTFRFLDGPQPLDPVVRTMKFDGADAPALTLSIAITDNSGAMLTSDALPDPFPTVNIANSDGGFNIAHTFSLKDSGGTLLMQLSTLVNQ